MDGRAAVYVVFVLCVGCVSLSNPAPAQSPKRIIYLRNDSSAGYATHDTTIIDALGSSGLTVDSKTIPGLGYEIIEVQHTTDPADYTAVDGDLIFVSNTVSSGNIQYHTDDPLPIVMTESGLFDNGPVPRSDMYFSSGWGNLSGLSAVDIVDTSHPITAAFPTGNLTTWRDTGNFPELGVMAGTIADAVSVLAVNPQSPAEPCLAVAEAGATDFMPGGTGNDPAPARRVCLGFGPRSMENPTFEGVILLQRTVQWAIGDPVNAGDAELPKATVVRAIYRPYTPGGETTVTLVATPIEPGPLTVVETLPAGWTASVIGATAGTATTSGTTLTWNADLTTTPEELAYSVLAPPSACGSVSIAGLFTAGASRTVGGDTELLQASDGWTNAPIAWMGSIDIPDTLQPGGRVEWFFCDDSYLLWGQGADIWGTADEFHFLYTYMLGDFVISARVEHTGPDLDSWSKAGLMARADLTTGSPNVILHICRRCRDGEPHIIAMERVDQDGGSSRFDNRPDDPNPDISSRAPNTGPAFLTLMRVGPTISVGFDNLEGTSRPLWYGADRPNIPADCPVAVGLVYTSHNRGALGSARFTNVSLTGNICDPTPEIAVRPTSFSVVARQNDTTPTRELEIWNSGSGWLSYDIATSSPSWIEITPPSGKSCASSNTHQVVFKISGLAPGAYTSRITINGNATNMPFVIPVRFTVLANDCPLPAAPTNPRPVHDAVNVSTNTHLAWDPGQAATTQPIGTQVVIRFDDLGAEDIVVSDQYAAQGVTFGSLDGCTPTTRLATSPVIPAEPMGLACLPYYTNHLVNFLQPTNAAGAIIDFGFVGDGVRLEAFDGPDGTGNVLLTTSTVVEGFLGLTAPDIASLKFSKYTASGSTTYLIDNLTFWKTPSCPETYDVYLGASPSAMTPVCTDLTTTTCSPGPLAAAAVYYWQVMAKNAAGQTPGPVWSFTTAGGASPAMINLADVGIGVPGVRVDGAAHLDMAGMSASGAGDFNSDGVADFLIAASSASPEGRTRAGEAYVVYGWPTGGGPGSVMSLSSLDGTNGIRFPGPAAYDRLSKVSGLGDVNGDRGADVLFGAWGDSGQQDYGDAYLLFGAPLPTGFGSPFDLSALDGTGGMFLETQGPTRKLGESIAGAGDVNGDGLADFLLGMPEMGTGGAFLVYGAADLGTSGPALDFRRAGVTIRNFTNYGDLGESVSGAGDVNGDGYDDILIGAPNAGPDGKQAAGEVYLIYGSPTGIGPAGGVFELSTLDGTNGVRFGGLTEGGHLGRSVTAAGDVNGDGYGDILIGAHFGGPQNEGEAFLLYGSASGTGTGVAVDLSTLDGTNGVRIIGVDVYENCADQLGGAGDVNGDGFADVLIAAFGADPAGRENAGAVYLVYGSPSEIGAGGVLRLSNLDGTNGVLLAGPSDNSVVGRSVSTAGDVNADGIDDFLVGAQSVFVPDLGSPGVTYLIFGFTAQSEAAYTAFARSGDAPAAWVGVVGNGSDGDVGAGRCSIDFGGGSGPGNAGASRQTVTLFRSKPTGAGLPPENAVAGVFWRVDTDRTGWSTAELTFKYCDGEISGLNESRLEIHRADVAGGPWSRVDGVVDAATNEITCTVSSLPALFALAQTGPAPTEPSIAVFPAAFAFTVEAGASPAGSTLDVWNDGAGTLSYNIATSPSSTLNISPASGQSSGRRNAHALVLNTSSLSTGTHTLHVTISGNGANSPVTVPVRVSVWEPEMGSISTGFLGPFPPSVEQGQGPLTSTLLIVGHGGGTMPYDIVASPPWFIQVAPASGDLQPKIPKPHTVTLNTQALSPGTYHGFLVITADATNSPLVLTVPMTVTGPPNLTVSLADTGPVAPIQLQPGDPIVLSALIENNGGGPAGPLWTEVWGSRTGGLQLDRFLSDSLWLGGLPMGGSHSWATTAPLYGLPDGPYTVVYTVDRPDDVDETDERDNRVVVAGKRLLVIRPQTQVDLAVEGFGLAPNPVQDGQPVAFSGQVINRGSEPSGAFWVEFWGSWDRPYPSLSFFLCDSILVTDLDSGQVLDLATYSRTLYTGLPAGVFQVGCFADRDDTISESDETNNYEFIDGQVFNEWTLRSPRGATGNLTGADLTILSADFDPASPVQSQPGDGITLIVEVANEGNLETGPFWLEFWGSRDGGLTLHDFLAGSARILNLPPGQTFQFTSPSPLYSIPDGPYTVVVAVDRPGDLTETEEANNRRAVAGKRLLVVRPATDVNLTIESFNLATPGVDAKVSPTGVVRNTGTVDSGPFWIEFWACPGDPDYPDLNRFAADSIDVSNLAPGEQLNIADHPRALYSQPPGQYVIIGIVDRLDQVIETDETDNYAILRGYRFGP